MNKSNIIFLLSIYCAASNGQDITDGTGKNAREKRSSISETKKSTNKESLPGQKEEANKFSQFKHVDISRVPGGIEILMGQFSNIKY